MDTDGQKRRIKPAEVLLFPLIMINKGLTFILKKAIGENYGEDVTEDDIMSMVDAGTESGAIEDDSAELISNVFEFDDLRADDVMTHRVNITAFLIILFMSVLLGFLPLLYTNSKNM